jgi:hypothetical protein
MIHRRIFFLSLARLTMVIAITVAGAASASSHTEAATVEYRRLTLPGGGPQVPFPYTLEVPQGWTARQVPDDPGLWIGPPDAKPNEDPRMIYVRISTVSLANPEVVASSIRINDTKDDSWSAPLVEVREVNGTRGVLVETERGKGAEARRNLTLKVPLPKTSVDFIGQAKGEDFAKHRATYERILMSVAPAAPAAAPAKKN